MEDKIANSTSELDDLHQENKNLQSSIIDEEKKEDNMDDYIKNKIMDWQQGQSIGLGAREKGSCVAFLFDRINDLTKEVEKLKNGK